MSAPAHSGGWLRSRWLDIPEPRDMSMIYAVLYAVTFTTGIAALVQPPRAIVSQHGAGVMLAMGVLLIVGACSAALGGYATHMQLERVGITICALALACFGYLVLSETVAVVGTRLLQLGVIILALGMFVVRYRSIRGFTYKPRG